MEKILGKAFYKKWIEYKEVPLESESYTIVLICWLVTRAKGAPLEPEILTIRTYEDV